MLLPLLQACSTASPKQLAPEVYTILDAYWMLLSLEGQSPQAPNNTRTAYIRLQEGENDLKGFTGCNNLFGKYELNGNSLKFKDLATTRMMCPSIEQENKLLRVLERVDSFRISDKILTLYQGDEAIATFRTGNRESVDNEVPDGRQ